VDDDQFVETLVPARLDQQRGVHYADAPQVFLLAPPQPSVLLGDDERVKE
jgi:hypothetical protein